LATFTKRGNFQWQAKIRRQGYSSQTKTFGSKADAETWVRLIEGEMDRGAFISRAEAESTTLKNALERYATEISSKKKGAAQEITRIKRWQKHDLAVRFLSTIKGSDFAKFRDKRRAEGKAENTIRLDLALISHFFETARKDWGMESLANPVKNIKLPGGSKQRERRLEEDELRYLAAALLSGSQPVGWPIVELAIHTAMRQGEILGLRWENVDFNRRFIFLADTKNGSSRNVPLSSSALTILSMLTKPIGGGKIFNISQDRLIRTFQRACIVGKTQYLRDCENANRKPVDNFLDELRFHDLRHEATTRLFELGLDIMEVASITGHKSLSMLRRYTHLRVEDLVRKLG
jgi:integrase